MLHLVQEKAMSAIAGAHIRVDEDGSPGSRIKVIEVAIDKIANGSSP